MGTVPSQAYFLVAPDSKYYLDHGCCCECPLPVSRSYLCFCSLQSRNLIWQRGKSLRTSLRELMSFTESCFRFKGSSRHPFFSSTSKYREGQHIIIASIFWWLWPLQLFRLVILSFALSPKLIHNWAFFSSSTLPGLNYQYPTTPFLQSSPFPQ